MSVCPSVCPSVRPSCYDKKLRTDKNRCNEILFFQNSHFFGVKYLIMNQFEINHNHMCYPCYSISTQHDVITLSPAGSQTQTQKCLEPSSEILPRYHETGKRQTTRQLHNKMQVSRHYTALSPISRPTQRLF